MVLQLPDEYCFNKEPRHSLMSLLPVLVLSVLGLCHPNSQIHCFSSIKVLRTKKKKKLLQTTFFYSFMYLKLKKSPSSSNSTFHFLPPCSCPSTLSPPPPPLRHWPSEPRVRPERGLRDLQLCLLSTQTSVRTAGRERKGQTEERHECT